MLSTRHIAELIFSSRAAVKDNLVRLGIPLRPADEARRMKTGQTRFGRRVVGGREIEHKGELEQLEKMKLLRAQGNSYRQIAAIMTWSKVPTKTGKPAWAAATVMKMLKAGGVREESNVIRT